MSIANPANSEPYLVPHKHSAHTWFDIFTQKEWPVMSTDSIPPLQLALAKGHSCPEPHFAYW